MSPAAPRLFWGTALAAISLLVSPAASGQAAVADTLPRHRPADTLTPRRGSLVVTLVPDAARAAVHLAASPFRRWDAPKALRVTLSAGAAAAAYLWADGPWNDMVVRQPTSFLRFSRGFSAVGEPLVVGAGIVASGAVAWAAGESRLAEISYLSAQAFGVSMLYCLAAKALAGRARPSESADHRRWHGPRSFFWGHNSFYSGHASALFSVATVLATESSRGWVAPVAYGVAGLAAAARSCSGEHWLSDIVAGAALSHMAARAVVSLHRRRCDGGFVSSPRSITVFPTAIDTRPALGLAARF